MKIKMTSVYVDDQEKALRFYTEVLGFAKKNDFSNGPFRWLTVASPDDPGGTELQLALNNNPAAKTYQQALFDQSQPAAMFYSDDVQADYDRMRGGGAQFTMPPTDVTASKIAVVNDTCGNLIQLIELEGLVGLDTKERKTPTNKSEEQMSDLEHYEPGPAHGARIEKDGEKWTLILVRELRHPPALVWQALTDPAELHGWAPFEADGKLDSVGATIQLTWVSTGAISETRVTRADAPRLLEYHDLRWQLEPLGHGTRLTLWHNIDRRFIAWGAASWHICFDVLDRLLAGAPMGRLAGADAMKFEGWQRLKAEYATQFGS